jgi:rare lipoprotein A
MYFITKSEVVLISLTKGTIIFVMSLLLGFTIVTKEFKTENVKISKDLDVVPAQINDSSSENKTESIIKFIDEGKMLASWYGPKFHGRKTANGEFYDQMAFTAAHKSLPFGTLLKLTNLKNLKSVIVRVNDRGPYINNRDLDLSKGAALALGMIKRGVIKLKVEKVTLADENRPLIALK